MALADKNIKVVVKTAEVKHQAQVTPMTNEAGKVR